MTLREIVFNKLKEQNKLELWPKVRIEIFSMENQGICDQYIELYESGYKCENTINSWVAYILGICDQEPSGEMKIIKAPKLADIDSDFDSERRDEIIAFIKDWFGEDNVSQIATYGQYKIKSSIQDILKYQMSTRGEDPTAAIAISSNISQEIENLEMPMEQKMDLAIESSPELSAYLNRYPEERELIDGMIGSYKSIGMHAAGIVIGPESISNIVPMAATTKGAVTAADKIDIEAMGLVKFDILGVSNITKMAHCLKMIKERTGKDIDLGREVDLEDKRCLSRFNAGDVDTIFQFETSEFQEILTNQVEVDSFSDLVDIVAINRPGPKTFVSDKFYEKYRTKEPDNDGNIDPPVSPIGTYAGNKKNQYLIAYPHPELESILMETYGIPIYQEQIMRIVQVLSGASMADADKLRDAIGKKKLDLFNDCVKSFSVGCKKNGIDDDVIDEVVSLIKKFGKYCFNKAHAAAYTTLSFWNMWLKTYYPTEWYTAVFTVEFLYHKNKMLQPCYVKGTNINGKFSTAFTRKLDWYIYGASSGGFNGKYKKCSVYSPSLNISHHQKAVILKVGKEDRIYLPFSIIDGLGGNMLPVIENRELMPNKKYSNMREFVEYSGISESLAIKLIDNGVLEDDFGDDILKLHAELIYYLRIRQEQKRSLQQRNKKTDVEIDEQVKYLFFGDFNGVNSIQMLNENNLKTITESLGKADKKISIDKQWF